MWSTQLTVSYLLLVISSIFYLTLIILCLVLLADTYLNAFTMILVLVLIIEWWRSFHYLHTIKGELALFHYIHQIYWHKQRWYIMRKPLLFRYLIILNLKSRRNGNRQTLLIMIDSMQPDNWRTLHYYLKQLELI
ncbi:hypothetical protein A9G13_05475 [Gilliamella sp. wkB178]|uniref:protein YgfX n=1 Tax=Gilliamella sp. wkB178 TaxID=3120259 RepID=UPI00080ECAC5|nr:protein YgfX [Gilliamella apicola]OCG07668.1 hypothetical protein A9G13_05475 [Gilliamella apicola]